LPVKLGEEPGFANAGLADDSDHLGMAALDMPQETLQHCKLAASVDEIRQVA
jgi:hypothetical protein